MTSGSSSMASTTLSASGWLGRLFLVGRSSAPHRRLSRGRAKRDGDGEGRAHPYDTLDGEVSAQKPGEPTADRQTQTRAAVGTGGATLDLTKFFEDQLNLVFRYPDASICHREGEVTVLASGAHRYASLRRKFHRVAEQIHQDLPQFVRIGEQRR